LGNSRFTYAHGDPPKSHSLKFFFASSLSL
jgi:hypothetical protein